MLYQSANLRLETHYRIATLWLGVPGPEVNPLTRAVLADFDAAVTAAAAHPGLDVLVLRSARADGFSTGADPDEWAGLTTPDEASELARQGQEVCRRLAALAPVTVAFLDGPCLGGGLELALACDYRVASGGPGTRLGLPQVKQGWLPCWGGTQRLPHLVGYRAARELLLSGRKLSAKQSLDLGLVDRAYGQRMAGVHLAAFALDLQKRPRKPTRSRRFLTALWSGVRAALRRSARLPADGSAAAAETLRAVECGRAGGMPEGLACERAAAGRLLPAFRRGAAAVRLREAPAPEAAPPRGDPKALTVGVVGCGTVGAAVAQWAALCGCRVVVRERDGAALAAAEKRLTANFREAAARRLVTPEDLPARQAAVGRTTAWDGFEYVDLLVEAVGEDLALKQRVLREAEKHLPRSATFATTTTTLTVGAVQGGLVRPQRLVGLHFPHPATALKPVEIAAGPATEPAAVARWRDWLRSLGKHPFLVADRPGFALARVMLPYFHEAILLAAEGVTVADVDAAAKGFGMAWGPLETVDALGIDAVRAMLAQMQLGLGDALAPPPLLTWLDAHGWLGRKSGAGFYRHGRGKRRPNPALSVPATAFAPVDRGSRLVLRLVNAAAAGLGEGRVRDAAALDNLLVFGAGWPVHRGGPLRYAGQCGWPAVARDLEGLAARHGTRFLPCAEVRRRAGGMDRAAA
jgi:3-hydroxyacyl-CoA dehydrogenase/enoyl-CoA hydratase/3-hydroxybutyryl-CoA epimerase